MRKLLFLLFINFSLILFSIEKDEAIIYMNNFYNQLSTQNWDLVSSMYSPKIYSIISKEKWMEMIKERHHDVYGQITDFFWIEDIHEVKVPSSFLLEDPHYISYRVIYERAIFEEYFVLHLSKNQTIEIVTHAVNIISREKEN